MNKLIDTLIALDFEVTDSYEDDEYDIYRYDIEGYLPGTDEFLYMTFDLTKDSEIGCMVVLTYVFRNPVGEVGLGGLIWDEGDRGSEAVATYAVKVIVSEGMKETQGCLAGIGKDPDSYVYSLGEAEFPASEVSGDYEDDDTLTLPVFSYGNYKNGKFIAERSFAYKLVSGFLYKMGSNGKLTLANE